ncbi:IS110 family RNA-guided transposase [Chryseobacterium kwangjuense]|uniref:Uncharacterized protein n=1 Tax=Chryseobacterium kwangjuense TaxID=267125 RepID=A0A135WM73_9FLAO|nr:IS110 family transposase [Chryseobacterium kwangjuense]KXH86004.1 hypothetical protein AU378_03620 [Chryseobacterium kwangjuense]
MRNLKYTIGADVSMKEIVCCLSVINDEQEVKVKATHKFPNSKTGFIRLLSWTRKQIKEELPVNFIMEATGVYHEQLAWFLYDHDKIVCILLPNKAKNWMKASGAKSKNDSIDAKGLAKIGAERKLEVWTPPSKNLLILRDCTRRHQALNEIRTVTNNQLHAILHSQFQSKIVVKQLKTTLKLIESQLQEMEDTISSIISDDPILLRHHNNITSIKGLSTLSFAVIIAETNGFALFKKVSALINYAGYDVIENQSGSHVGRTKISKKGNSRIRRVLHMPALCAVRDDQPQFKNLFIRIYDRTKIKMKAYVAIQKKLLMMVYFLWKKECSYNPNFVHTERQSTE